jgi:hypothetical protein
VQPIIKFRAPNYAKHTPEEVIWDEKDLLEFAEGKISNVFGREFAIIDTYPRRVMLPMSDYLLVSRVTKNTGKVHEYKPCMMTTEYDLPINGSFSRGGDIPWCILVESGQCDLLLISYLGIDFQNKGNRTYRLLNTTVTWFGVAEEGETLRYEIYIDTFTKEGDKLLFFFHYDCYVEDRLIIEMRGGCAGFFTEEELAAGQGVLFTPAEMDYRDPVKSKTNAMKQKRIAKSKPLYDQLYKAC